MSNSVTTNPENEITENSEVDQTSGIHLTGESPEATEAAPVQYWVLDAAGETIYRATTRVEATCYRDGFQRGCHVVVVSLLADQNENDTTIDGDECLELADQLVQVPLYAVSAGDRIALVTTHKSQADTFIETFNRHKREDALPAVVVEGRFFPMNMAPHK